MFAIENNRSLPLLETKPKTTYRLASQKKKQSKLIKMWSSEQNELYSHRNKVAFMVLEHRCIYGSNELKELIILKLQMAKDSR